MLAPETDPTSIRALATPTLRPNPFSASVYGDADAEIAGLLDGIREHGILVPLVVHPLPEPDAWTLISGHRRLACARTLHLPTVPCVVRTIADEDDRRRAVLEYNRQRPKTYSQKMREADALSDLLGGRARERSLANLRTTPNQIVPPDHPNPNDYNHPSDRRNSDDRPVRGRTDATIARMNHPSDRRNSDDRPVRGRTDATIARMIDLGGKDLYRQARAIWQLARQGDPRARSGVEQLDAGTKTIHAAYKDLRRRDRYTANFRPTPYDVWSFKHDRAFGIPHPGSIPPSIIAHTLHYYTRPDALVVDPMAGGGTTLDVCQSMGRRCLAYDVAPTRPDVRLHDITTGFPPETRGADLIFCDPPYHTMLADAYAAEGVANVPLTVWIDFLKRFALMAFATLAEGGHLAFLVANQTEKDLPAGHGYLDHAFLAYGAIMDAGFAPERRISCPMDGAYLPQHVRQARVDGRMLGQVRDLIVARKPRTRF